MKSIDGREVPTMSGMSKFYNGGAGSGNFGHEGRPGLVGGSGGKGVGGVGEGSKAGGGVGKGAAKEADKGAGESSKRLGIERTNLKEWYKKEFPDDDYGAKLSNIDVADVWDRMGKGEDVYDVIGIGDSLVRERIFEKLADDTGLDYDTFYYTWLGNGGERASEHYDSAMKAASSSKSAKPETRKAVVSDIKKLKDGTKKD